ncbi:hypothetical protein BJ875DRAFT_520044 [Amylocarpus encephaloides]|uniref:DUF6604 domain-containing protein n=1 Tax=Amylocarpus encephaloides TaxID=45428 RepID=A0A9P7YB47_9HELO|nr:hypothetical protein BJ875DRAFT_520044 [Amylocarpus encephaloides]
MMRYRMIQDSMTIQYRRKFCKDMITGIRFVVSRSRRKPHPGVMLNTTGHVEASQLVPLSKLISKHVRPIPSTIYHLLQSVIELRSGFHLIFQQIAASNPDPKIERGNVSHKIFINTLEEAFEVLGGREWKSKQRSENTGPSQDHEEEETEDVTFANKFASLAIDRSNACDPAEVSDDETLENDSDNTLLNKPMNSSGRRHKKDKRGKRSKKPSNTAQNSNTANPSLNDYCFIDGSESNFIEYLIAIMSLSREIAGLRREVQSIWHEVAYEGLNAAVGGAMSKMATSMIKQIELAIFVDFPGYDLYETMMYTITFGNPNDPRIGFRLRHSDEKSGAPLETPVDVREQFLIYAFTDLVDFVTDFQHTRTGKPTKRMLGELQGWDPLMDLQHASTKKRMRWRRAYTINWLYDLVNVFSHVVIQRNKLQRHPCFLEQIDWSTKGPWHVHRRLFGLNEFAGHVTHLAMQKPGTEFRKKILPHHVFQLQCIVDSFTVSRGWYRDILLGDVLEAPVREFCPTREIDQFLDREGDKPINGFSEAAKLLVLIIQKSGENIRPLRNQVECEILDQIYKEFLECLGESKYKHGLEAMPLSRFANTNRNGLWDFSPYLCGVGLLEALELSYGVSLLLWDRMPEPLCLVHLHNLLLQKGYIQEPVEIYDDIQSVLGSTLFVDGKIPKSDFLDAFRDICGASGPQWTAFTRQTIRHTTQKAAKDFSEIFEMNPNRFLKKKSLLRLYREADWIPDRIPEDEVFPISGLGVLRMGLGKRSVDPLTVDNARYHGISEDLIVDYRPKPETTNDKAPSRKKCHREYPSKTRTIFFSNLDLLRSLKMDFIIDVTSTRKSANSGFNYTAVLFLLMVHFEDVENELQQQRNPVWVEAYEGRPRTITEKRIAFTKLALRTENKECLEAVAIGLQKIGGGVFDHAYWQTDVYLDNLQESLQNNSRKDYPQCPIM